MSGDPDRRRSATKLERWLTTDRETTLGSLIELFGNKSFAILFVLLLGVPALPPPTGGATHVFEIIAVLLALELIANREEIRLPQGWRRLQPAEAKQQRFITGLMKMIRRLARFSRPRLRFLFGHRLSNIVFGLLVIGGSAGAFLAPPFTGLDTLPSLGSCSCRSACFSRTSPSWWQRSPWKSRASRSRSCSAAQRSTVSGSSRRPTGEPGAAGPA